MAKSRRELFGRNLDKLENPDWVNPRFQMPLWSGHSIYIAKPAAGPPRDGFVLRHCIRKADQVRGEAVRSHGLAGTTFCRCRERTHQPVLRSGSPWRDLSERCAALMTVQTVEQRCSRV
jgi:hypothetical protein